MFQVKRPSRTGMSGEVKPSLPRTASPLPVARMPKSAWTKMLGVSVELKKRGSHVTGEG